jgi:hypothetical protein
LDRVPDSIERVTSSLIAMAASLTGDPEEVRKAMRCSYEDLLQYSAAKKKPSQAELDALVGMIIREQGNLIAKNRELLAQMEERIKRS